MSSPEELAREELEIHYRHTLEGLGKEPGLIGVIFRKAQNKIQDPAKLRRLIADLIDKEEWSSLDTDVKGDAYEGLLQKNAEDVKSGAGQYFTPRPLIRAIVDVMQPQPGESASRTGVICDPACGTGGFLLIAHEFIRNNNKLDKKQLTFLNTEQLRGVELVDSVARLCCMNLVLHGIGAGAGQAADAAHVPVMVKDALAGKHGEYEMVLTNPPFGRRAVLPLSTKLVTKRNNRSSFIATTFGPAPATNNSISCSTFSRS
jgi:type I restriction enzyme M protein